MLILSMLLRITGYTQEKLANFIGVSRASINTWLIDNNSMSNNSKQTIANIFQFPVSYFEIDLNEKFKLKRVDYVDDIISLEDKELIDKMVDRLSDYSTTKLVSITHKQTPWKEAYECGKNTVITNESIRRYFNG